MSRVLITGGTGFIGRHLVPHLHEQGYDIRCLVRPTSDVRFLQPYDVEFVHGNMSDPDSLRKAVDGVDTVFHLAGVAQVVWNQEFHELHVKGTQRLAEICAESTNPPCLIHVSSLAAVGPARNGVAVDETTPCRPISPYGRSKRDAEIKLHSMASRIPCSIVRPPYVIGEWDHASVPLFRSIYKNRLHVIPGWFNNLYSFIHATDLAKLLNILQKQGERIEKNSVSGKGIYNAANSEMIPFGDFGKMIGEAFGYDQIRVRKVPPAAALVGAASLEIYKKITNQTVAFDWNKIVEGLRGPWILSDGKIKAQFHFTAEKPLRERIAQTVQWYLENGLLE